MRIQLGPEVLERFERFAQRITSNERTEIMKKKLSNRPFTLKVTMPPIAVTSFKFELGVHVRDVVTGFRGVVTGRVQYLTGCSQFLIQPQGLVGGRAQESFWIDEAKLEAVRGKKRIVLTVADRGGPQANEAPKR